METNELLEMKLKDISDLLLSELSPDKDMIKCDLPGCNVKTRERFVLTVSLMKETRWKNENEGESNE